MDPLNKKERTASFLQFMVMFLLSIVFVVVGIFFDVVFFRKDYKILKKENEQLQQIGNLNLKIVELNQELDALGQAVTSEYDWDEKSLNFKDKMEDALTLGTDSSDFQKLGANLQNTFKTAMLDKKKFIDSKDCALKIKEKEDEIKQLNKDYKDLEKEKEKLEDRMRTLTPLN